MSEDNKNEFDTEEVTAVLVSYTEEELAWMKLIRQRAATRNIRKPEHHELQWIRTIKQGDY